MSRWRETIGHGFGTGRNKGAAKAHDVLNEDTGKVGGQQIEHWDGSMDAIVRPETVRWSFGGAALEPIDKKKGTDA